MNNHKKFEGFKQQLIEDNEKQYGAEVREKYGDDALNHSNEVIQGITQEEHEAEERLSQEVNETLKAAFELGDPTSELAHKACELHKEWLSFYWDSYSKDKHMCLAQMYVNDPRFTAYYDKIAPGCAVFLRDAVVAYCRG
ncbi:MAG: TipAS antibiotic-recognition domain-containing protein [Coriobacteriales bacterium]|jgi:hypothetical protein|nr:TipAS antibiotic-recognition domain-containing protein [Coriobacteriales bacterium]